MGSRSDFFSPSFFRFNITVRQLKCENEINNFVGGTADLKLGIEGENSPEYGNYDDDDDNLFCNQIFNSTEFVLQSPNYPRPYPNDIDCNILVYPPNDNICSLELRFDEFRIEPSSGQDGIKCDNDYLIISGQCTIDKLFSISADTVNCR